MFESVCAAHAVVIVGIIDFSCLQRQLGDICLSTFGSCLGKKKEQMRFAVRDKSVRALWENMIGPVGAEELKNRPPYPSCFKLSAAVLNSISSVYLSAGRQTRLFCRRRLKE